ncbi:Molybdenum cofactor biosynthesis protein MoaB [Clostridiaceae bacterium JG1575]|nr:Molybdenum cofactor biosynthesis protein MoaB [Clostridiaceae bacterium JG1575]
MYLVGIITVSDKGARGERLDRSKDVIEEVLRAHGYQSAAYRIVPDEKKEIQQALRDFCDEAHLPLVLTTGGTGFSLRDITPEATAELLDRRVPGIAEVMRARSLEVTPRAMLSRGIAGLRGRSLIINLPGSPKACRENLEAVIEPLAHGLDILWGEAVECAAPELTKEVPGYKHE